MIYCILNHLRPNDRIAVNGGEGLVVFVGHWSLGATGLLSLRFVKMEDPYSSADGLRSQGAESAIVELRSHDLTISGQQGIFKQERWMTAKDYDELVDPIVKAHRRSNDLDSKPEHPSPRAAQPAACKHVRPDRETPP